MDLLCADLVQSSIYWLRSIHSSASQHLPVPGLFPGLVHNKTKKTNSNRTCKILFLKAYKWMYNKLRFIWPCKSDCQLIFPKMQRTYSFFAKLWFVRPLIFQICDSSPRYLSNVTFWTSFAYQMREEYVLLKKIVWKLDLKGGK